MSERFSLKWIDFQKNAARIFDLLRTEKDFLDVTLVGGDLQQVSAHKLVLSASSPFFRTILRQNPHSSPLLFLDEVSSSELSLVLDYIYLGEVRVRQEELDRFLLVARKLQLDGLSEEEPRNLMEQLNNETGEQDQEQELMIPEAGDILMEKLDGLYKEEHQQFENPSGSADFEKKPETGDILGRKRNVEDQREGASRSRTKSETEADCLANPNRYLVQEDLQNLIISQNPGRSIKFTQSQRQNTQLVLEDFILKKNRGPIVKRGCRVINWKCEKQFCHFTASTKEGKLVENGRHNHPAQPDIVLYKETRAILRQNIAVTEEDDRSLSSLVERVVGQTGEKVGRISALKQVARRHNRKVLTASSQHPPTTTRSNKLTDLHRADLTEQKWQDFICVI